MLLKTGGHEVELLALVPGSTVRMVTAEPVEPGPQMEVWTTLQGEEGEEPFLLASYAAADWLRVVTDGCNITLTNQPEPGPAPEPVPPEPTADEVLNTVLGVGV